MKSNLKKIVLKGLMATSAITPFIAFSPVMAQEQKVEASKGNETIVVTARRRQEALKDVPIAVSSFNSAKLEATGAPDITILQQVSPNTTMQAARGTNSTLIAFIRGVGQQDPLWGFEPGVGLYVDDVYVVSGLVPTVTMSGGVHTISVLITDDYGNQQTFSFEYEQGIDLGFNFVTGEYFYFIDDVQFDFIG